MKRPRYLHPPYPWCAKEVINGFYSPSMFPVCQQWFWTIFGTNNATCVDWAQAVMDNNPLGPR